VTIRLKDALVQPQLLASEDMVLSEWLLGGGFEGSSSAAGDPQAEDLVPLEGRKVSFGGQDGVVDYVSFHAKAGNRSHSSPGGAATTLPIPMAVIHLKPQPLNRDTFSYCVNEKLFCQRIGREAHASVDPDLLEYFGGAEAVGRRLEHGKSSLWDTRTFCFLLLRSSHRLLGGQDFGTIRALIVKIAALLDTVKRRAASVLERRSAHSEDAAGDQHASRVVSASEYRSALFTALWYAEAVFPDTNEHSHILREEGRRASALAEAMPQIDDTPASPSVDDHDELERTIRAAEAFLAYPLPLDMDAVNTTFASSAVEASSPTTRQHDTALDLSQDSLVSKARSVDSTSRLFPDIERRSEVKRQRIRQQQCIDRLASTSQRVNRSTSMDAMIEDMMSRSTGALPAFDAKALRASRKKKSTKPYSKVRVVCVDPWSHDPTIRRAEYGLEPTSSPMPRRHAPLEFDDALINHGARIRGHLLTEGDGHSPKKSPTKRLSPTQRRGLA